MLESISIQQRVFVIGDGSLLSEGVTRILEEETSLRVSCATYSDDQSFLDIIVWDKPEVILVCESGKLDVTHIFEVVLSQQFVIGLLIIIIRLSNNMIDVYANATLDGGKFIGKPKQISPMTKKNLLIAVRRNHNE